MKPNVMIIVMDAVRAQNVPIYGYHRNTMPFLSSIRSELSVYENAISSSYWTMPSIASLFTGMYTSTHGLLVDGDTLDEKFLTLPSALKKYGYNTAGFVKNVYVSPYSGLDRGFDDFVSEYSVDAVKKVVSTLFRKQVNRLQPPGITRADESSEQEINPKKKALFNMLARSFDVMIDRGSHYFHKKLSGWLKHNRDKPFFVYTHLFETHSPYRSPFKYALKFSNLRDNYKKLSINHDHLKYLLGQSKMSAEDFQILQSFYDNSIYYADHIISRIFKLLKKYDVYDNTMVVILADHGDNLGDHGLMFHYFCLYDTLVKIPLLIKYPKTLNLTGSVSEVVQNVDIFPTILSLLNIEDKKTWEQVQGNDLLGKARSRRKQGLAVSELIKAFGPERVKYRDRLQQYDRRLLSIRTRDRKFIYSSNGSHEYYNLSDDPGETNNLYYNANTCDDLEHEASIRYEKMNEFYLDNINKIEGEINSDKIDASMIDRLKSLGYM